MKKLLSILSIAFTIAVIAPSCSSSDETFDEISSNSALDKTAPSNGSNGDKTPGGGG
ncbi:MAG: hypothetical protein JXR03_08315 [Cyclobacteriaceae bacterium]